MSSRGRSKAKSKVDLHCTIRHQPSDVTAKIADFESCQESYHLYGLPQPHLIPDYPPSLLSVQFPQPLHPCLLISGGKQKVELGAEVKEMGKEEGNIEMKKRRPKR